MIRMLLSGEYPFLAESLKEQGIEVILTEADPRLPAPLRFHPDMQLCRLKEIMFVLRGSLLKEQLKALGCDTAETDKEPAGLYPKDVLCNAFVLSDAFVCNPGSVDPAILSEAVREGLRIIAVRQGYAACAAVIVDENSVITADPGITDALRAVGFTVLQIQPGYIVLSGYDSGLIGGCCGLIEPRRLAVAGSLERHPDGREMLRFLMKRNVSVLELCKGPLLDVGGILRLE